MKKVAKKFVIALLKNQVNRLQRKNAFKTIAVAGSIGKTSTKFAIAEVLGTAKKVRFQEGNYNDPVTVPLVFFGHSTPSLINPFAWIRIFISNELQIRRDYPYDVVVLELGTDRPGEMVQFSGIHIDIGVLTAIGSEHMEFFGTLDSVAKEEMVIADLSDFLLVNEDLCSNEYLDQLSKPYTGYSINSQASYRLHSHPSKGDGYSFRIEHEGQSVVEASTGLASEALLYSVCSAAATGHLLGLSSEQIKQGCESIRPVSGRMQRLGGVNGSVILDDTYNASPDAAKSALDALYSMKAQQKIAILGNMNELGDYSEQAHREVGSYCNPSEISLVATIGPDANKYLAEAAAERGCTVKRFKDPFEAGEYIKSLIEPGAAILAKGSQNGVFAEEAVKILLADPKDSAKLVRQSKEWLSVKEKSFNKA